MSASRRMGIYDELASKIRSAALTSDLHRFVDTLARKFEVRSISDERVLGVLDSGNPDEILEVLRTETTLVVLMLRVHQEENKELAEARAADEARKAADARATLDAAGL
jgi:hypothetical protein